MHINIKHSVLRQRVCVFLVVLKINVSTYNIDRSVFLKVMNIFVGCEGNEIFV
jgi:polyisoprenoid-binding protein YceI